MGNPSLSPGPTACCAIQNVRFRQVRIACGRLHSFGVALYNVTTSPTYDYLFSPACPGQSKSSSKPFSNDLQHAPWRPMVPLQNPYEHTGFLPGVCQSLRNNHGCGRPLGSGAQGGPTKSSSCFLGP